MFSLGFFTQSERPGAVQLQNLEEEQRLFAGRCLRGAFGGLRDVGMGRVEYLSQREGPECFKK